MEENSGLFFGTELISRREKNPESFLVREFPSAENRTRESRGEQNMQGNWGGLAVFGCFCGFALCGRHQDLLGPACVVNEVQIIGNTEKDSSRLMLAASWP